MNSKRIADVLIFPIIGLVLLTSLSTSLSAKESKKATLGWVEKIHIKPWEIEVEAKLDPGAQTSSMQAEHIERFKKGDDEWVRFELEVKDERTNDFEREEVERPLVRDVRIKQHGEPNRRRPVVMMEFCINQHSYKTEFNLTDRDKYNYPVLLGREFLEEVALIDPSKTFVSEPECPNEE